MKSKDLIARLQELDPTGETHVCIGAGKRRHDAEETCMTMSQITTNAELYLPSGTFTMLLNWHEPLTPDEAAEVREWFAEIAAKVARYPAPEVSE